MERSAVDRDSILLTEALAKNVVRNQTVRQRVLDGLRQGQTISRIVKILDDEDADHVGNEITKLRKQGRIPKKYDK